MNGVEQDAEHKKTNPQRPGNQIPVMLVPCDDTDSEIDLFDIVDVLIQSWKTLALFCIVSLALLFLLKQPTLPSYTSQARLIATSTDFIIGTKGGVAQQVVQVSVYEPFYIGSEVFAAVKKRIRANEPDLSKIDLPESYIKQNLDVDSKDMTLLLSFTSPSPGLSQKILESVLLVGQARIEAVGIDNAKKEISAIEDDLSVILRQQADVVAMIEKIKPLLTATPKTKETSPVQSLAASEHDLSPQAFLVDLYRQQFELKLAGSRLEARRDALQEKIDNPQLLNPLVLLDPPSVPVKKPGKMDTLTSLVVVLAASLFLGAMFALFRNAYAKHLEKKKTQAG